MSHRSYLLPAVFLLLLAAGCARTRPAADLPNTLPNAFPVHTLGQILDQLLPPPDTLEALSARIAMAMTTPDGTNRFSATMNHRRHDSLYLSIRVTLGIEAARSLVTPDSFFVYDRIQQQIIYGSLDEVGHLIPAPFLGEDLFAELLGFSVPDRGIRWRVGADSTTYFLYHPRRRLTYQIDPTVWRVIYYKEQTRNGTIIEERVYEDYTLADGLIYPRRIIFRRPVDGMAATLTYRSLTLNPDQLNFDLQARSDAKRVQVIDL